MAEKSDLTVPVAECQSVGSMGLHQNNLLPSQVENSAVSSGQFSAVGFAMNNLTNRSVIDVFRDIRDRYFGKPQIHTNISRKPSLKRAESVDSEEGDYYENLESLPVYCKLMILSFLDTQDVCNISLVNSQWHEVANDQILWRELLIRDMCKWDSMTNKSQPLISQVWENNAFMKPNNGVNFFELLHGHCDGVNQNAVDLLQSQKDAPNRRGEGVNFKALYIHSSFQRIQDDVEESDVGLTIPGFIKSLWQGSEAPAQGEIIMTGPGMDSPRTSKLFRSLMWGNDFLATKGLLPGNRDGIGSGIQVLFKEKTPFNLIAMYSGNNRIRETLIGMERLVNSNVIELLQTDHQNGENVVDNGNSSGQRSMEFALYEAVRFYIAERKGHYKLIYVVDATASQKWADVSCNKLELAAILKGTELTGTIEAALGIPQEREEVNGERQAHNEDSIVSPFSREDHLPGKRPLLVLSCVDCPETERFSCMLITAMLGLPNISDRQWRVQDVIVSNLKGVEKGLAWLLKQT